MAEGQGFEPWVRGYLTMVFKRFGTISRNPYGIRVSRDFEPNLEGFSTRSVRTGTHRRSVTGCLVPRVLVRTVRLMSEQMTWLTVLEACEVARCSRAGLYKWWACGEGPRYVELGRKRLVRQDWLEDWMLAAEVRS